VKKDAHVNQSARCWWPHFRNLQHSFLPIIDNIDMGGYGRPAKGLLAP